MIVVYWLETHSDGCVYSEFKSFTDKEMLIALSYMEGLRKERYESLVISHVTMQSELSDSVGKPGVAELTGKDEQWYKRRIDPSIKLGREPEKC